MWNGNTGHPAGICAVNLSIKCREDAPLIRYYTIVWGDSLQSIATKYKVSVSFLQALNKIANPDNIQAGQRIATDCGHRIL